MDTFSGAGDFTARVWDRRRLSQRQSAITFTFDTKSRDVMSVKFFPEGEAFAAGLSNTEVHLYDIRASCKLATFYCDEVHNQFAVEKVAFSSSGRLLFVAYDQGRCFVYDVAAIGEGSHEEGPVNDKAIAPLHTNNENVKDVAVHKQGKCVAIGEERKQDTVAKIFWPKRHN